MGSSMDAIVAEKCDVVLAAACGREEVVGEAGMEQCVKGFCDLTATSATQIQELLAAAGGAKDPEAAADVAAAVQGVEETMRSLAPNEDVVKELHAEEEAHEEVAKEEGDIEATLAALRSLQDRLARLGKPASKWEQKRAEVLGEARRLLAQEYHPSVQVGAEPMVVQKEETEEARGGGAAASPSARRAAGNVTASASPLPAAPLFQFPLCEVSVVTKSFSELVERVVGDAFCEEEAAEGERRQAEAAETARTLLHSWRALVLQLHGQLIHQVPRVAATYHNDTMYLAHLIATFPARYPIHRLTAKTRRRLCMLDMVETLRDSGRDVLQQHVMEQLTGHLTSVGSLADTHEDEKRDAVQLILDQISYELKKLKAAWAGVLPASMLDVLIGKILDQILETMIDMVQQLMDLSEAETIQLHALFRSLLPLSSLFRKSGQAAYMQEKVAHWSKYQDVCAMFNMSMVGIVEKYKSGALRHFSRYEVRHWIKRLFSDSEFRQKNLQQIV